MRSRLALAATLAVLAPAVVAAQPAGDVELTVRLSAAATPDEAPAGDVTVHFVDAATREPVTSYVVQAAPPEQTVQVAVPALESRSGWLLWARSEGWWSPAAFIPLDEREASLTLVPEGLVRFAVDGTDTAVDFLETGKVWIDGRIRRRRVRLDRGLYGGPCEVDREPDRREVLIACPFARDEEVELRVRLGQFLPLLRPEVTVEADTDLGLVEPVRGARVTASLASPDGARHQFRLRQRVYAATIGPDGEVEERRRSFDFDGRGSQGSYVWRGIPAGDYELWIEDNRGNRLHHEVVRFFGQDHHYVELDAVPLVGRIRRGGEPLEDAMVWFGGMHGFERVSFRSREEGRFSGFLPREGHWPAEVTPAPDCDPCEGSWDRDGWGDFDSSEISGAGIFEIEADSDGIARVEIDLPAGTVTGRVVRRSAGSGVLEPIADARVWVHAAGEVAGKRHDQLLPSGWRRRTDADGTFEVTGLPEWEYTIYAESYIDEREVQSRPLHVRMIGQDRIEDLELELAEQKLITVVVRSGGVPLAGAQTFVLHPAGSGRTRANSHTRGAGTADHFLPPDVEVVDVVVRAGEIGMNGWSHDVRDGTPVEIDLSTDRGSLRVPNSRDALLVAPGGATIRIGTLLAVNNKGHVRRDGDEYVVTDLAPGTYSYCLPDGACRTADVFPWAESRVRE